MKDGWVEIVKLQPSQPLPVFFYESPLDTGASQQQTVFPSPSYRRFQTQVKFCQWKVSGRDVSKGSENNRGAVSALSSLNFPAEPECGSGFDLADVT